MAKEKTVGKRYSAEEKEEILAFVDEVNATKGRGGPAAAKKKYGVSPISLTNWQNKKSAKVSRPGVVRSSRANNPLRRMAHIADQIEGLNKSIASLEKEYAQLRKKI